MYNIYDLNLTSDLDAPLKETYGSERAYRWMPGGGSISNSKRCVREVKGCQSVPCG